MLGWSLGKSPGPGVSCCGENDTPDPGKSVAAPQHRLVGKSRGAVLQLRHTGRRTLRPVMRPDTSPALPPSWCLLVAGPLSLPAPSKLDAFMRHMGGPAAVCDRLSRLHARKCWARAALAIMRAAYFPSLCYCCRRCSLCSGVAVPKVILQQRRASGGCAAGGHSGGGIGGQRVRCQ